MARQIPFSEARQNLSALVDKVQNDGKAVTIIRHGKPAAVIISHDDYQAHFLANKQQRKWKVGGSGWIPKGVDIDAALKRGREARTKAWKASMKQLKNDLHGDD